MASFIRSLDDIVGHKYVIQFLKDKISKDTIPNVILFNGNAGIGKTSIAKVLAIAVNGNKQSLYKSIIDDNKSTDCVKLFNMSDVGDNTDEVVQELQGAQFSSTNRKVIILDEVHGMTKKAQDAILVTLEYLPENIYVFMCTTELSMLRQSLISRCVTFNLNNLTYNEIKAVIKKKIDERNLTFDLPIEVVLNLIATWSNNQPRRAINLLESFDKNCRVHSSMLQAFIPTDNVPVVLNIINYLYGSITQGIEFLDTLSITPDLLSTTLEVLKIALGGKSSIVTASETRDISKFFVDKSVDNFLKFVINVNSYNEVSKRVFIARFIQNHVSNFNGVSHDFSPTSDANKVYTEDQRTLGENALERLKQDATLLTAENREVQGAASIEALFDGGQVVSDGY